MIGKLHIDGIDAYSKYGIFITDSGYNGLLSYPPRKDVDCNDWHEENGTEYDLSETILDTYTMPLSFASVGTINKLRAFYSDLMNGAYHTFDVKNINRKYTLRLTSQQDLTMTKGLSLFNLYFANDYPLNASYKYTLPLSTITPQSGYKIDGKNFYDYGVYILQDSVTNINRVPEIRQNVIYNIKTKHGVSHDVGDITLKSNDITLNCLMRANSLSEFWRNYDSLFFDLIRPHERSLYIDHTKCEYPCFYKSCTVSSFYFSADVWMEFSLLLVCTTQERIYNI